MTDCIWCEHDTAVEVDSESADPNYDKEAYTNWTRYKCSTCGCVFVIGMKHIDFNDITIEGSPHLSVDAHCENCKHIDKYSNNDYPCNVCIMNEVQIHGPDHFEYNNYFEKVPE